MGEDETRKDEGEGEGKGKGKGKGGESAPTRKKPC